MLKGRMAAVGWAALAVLACGPSLAQTAAPQAAPAPQPEYHPSLGDLMTMAVQPRHTKLGLAAKQRNWAYATYETSELRNAFNRIARTIPTYRNNELSALFASVAKAPLDHIDAAIKARDGAALDGAYVEMTQACNACHQSLDHAYVVIQAPAGAPYPDQVFAPQP
jgi:hypothetical protein